MKARSDVVKRVALVDDHAVVRAGLKALVEDQPGYRVVAEGIDGADVECILSEVRPDILLLDLSMAQVSGLDALRQWRDLLPEVQILALSMHACADYVLAALKFGAQGYLLKDAAPHELPLALRALSRNQAYLSPGISRTVIQSAVIAPAPGTPRPPPPPSPLTPRQTEILRLICRGCSTRTIAEGLGLSVKTVDAHRAQMMERLGLRDIPSLVLYALRQGLVSLDD
ncbi:response regulator transcription factor [Stutzerimonas tarimensis]|uniref:Response regulator n=1 Tax=Stutzerimonas tarimensis TaxID=1507735 RepID=A0ABV7TA39_9GAMM